ncbi:MAG: type I restriction-modification system subunit M [Desulfobacteraceae bacterium]|nr:type I restriction-modification system subunit M [Desulfobacteraceae bacterium]
MDKQNIQQQINDVAWKACDTFRGVVDPSEYKNYILTFLFLKYLSDLWKDKKEEYMKKFKGDKNKVKRRMARERFILPENSSFDFLYENRNADNIGELINIALENIEEANKVKLEGVFRNIDFNSEANLGKTKDRNARLKHLIEDFSSPVMDLRPSKTGNNDIIGNTYMYLISNFASSAGKKGGEFYTPDEVAVLLAKLMQAKDGNRICDPACGSGSLLIRAADEIGSRNFSLYGQESNGATWALARMNMFLHERDQARLEWADTLRSPMLIEGDRLMKFDVVVANPPFSLDKWGADVAGADPYNRFHRGIPPKSKGDYAFITHMVETAVEGKGKVGVIVPHGVLFRGAGEGKIRQAMIEENLFEAVIGLPPNLFFGTGIPAAILVFSKGKKYDDVLFIDASREFEQGKNQNRLRVQDIEKIVATYKAFESVEKYAYRAAKDEIRENDYNLNIPRYVDTFEEEEEIDIGEAQREIEGIEAEMAVAQKEMAGYLNELGLIDS